MEFKKIIIPQSSICGNFQRLYGNTNNKENNELSEVGNSVSKTKFQMNV